MVQNMDYLIQLENSLYPLLYSLLFPGTIRPNI